LFFNDLALDLLVFPDGRQIVLDEDEFYSLSLAPQVRQRALTTLGELQTRFKRASSHPN
jgi:predicted RNA-binding protein associated with RNAse of E/G family